jgi:hypothetical protein
MLLDVTNNLYVLDRFWVSLSAWAFGIDERVRIDRWFPNCSARTSGGTRRTGRGYAKIILVMAENTQKKKRI